MCIYNETLSIITPRGDKFFLLTDAIRPRSPDFSTAPHFQAFWVGVVNDSVATFVKTFQEEAVGAFCQYSLEQQVEQSEWEQFYGEKTVVPVRKARRWVEPVLGGMGL